MKILKISISVVLIVMLAVTTIYAGGFQVNEHSARATAMGGAVFANLRDASAIYFNPGALSFIPGTDIVVGTTLIFPSSQFTGPAPLTTVTETESQFFYPSVLYASHTMNNGFSFGLGIFNPYGLGTEWAEDWAGRYLGIKSTLRTFFFNPTVAYRISDQLGIGAGFNYVYSTVQLTQAIPLVDPLTNTFVGEGMVDFDGTGNGYGWNIGLYYMPIDQLTLGIAYRSTVELDFEGEAEMDVLPPFQPFLPGGDVTTSITLPANLYTGISYQVNDNLNLNVGYQHVFWNVVDEIVIDFEEKTPVQDEQALELNYEDGYIIRFGAEYLANPYLALRAGFLFDSNPTPDRYMTPRLPDSDRYGFSLGFGYRATDALSIDFSYMYLQFADRTVENQHQGFNGTYESNAHLLGVNFRIRL